jgi:hypothetical protein
MLMFRPSLTCGKAVSLLALLLEDLLLKSLCESH